MKTFMSYRSEIPNLEQTTVSHPHVMRRRLASTWITGEMSAKPVSAAEFGAMSDNL